MKNFFRFSLPIGIAGIIINIILFATNSYYELVVPLIENSSLEGGAFKFFDDLIFYTPVIFIILFAAYMIAGFVYKKKSYAKTEDKVTEKLIQENEAVQKDLDIKAEYLKHKYYTNCPNCGAPGAENESVCRFCGESLIVKENRK